MHTMGGGGGGGCILYDILYVYVQCHVQVCVMYGKCACTFLGGKEDISVCMSVCAFVQYMHVQMCVYCITVGCAYAFTCDFSDSGVLAARMIARLFF